MVEKKQESSFPYRMGWGLIWCFSSSYGRPRDMGRVSFEKKEQEWGRKESCCWRGTYQEWMHSTSFYLSYYFLVCGLCILNASWHLICETFGSIIPLMMSSCNGSRNSAILWERLCSHYFCLWLELGESPIFQHPKICIVWNNFTQVPKLYLAFPNSSRTF